MFKLESGIYINNQQITHIVPNEGGSGAIAFFVNGKSVSLSDNDLKWIDFYFYKLWYKSRRIY